MRILREKFAAFKYIHFFYAQLLNLIVIDFSDEDDATTSGHNIDESEKRVIFINQLQPQKYCNNHISTAKYR